MILESNVSTSARLRKRAVLTLLPLVLGASTFTAAQEPELLEPEKAFRISTQPLDERNVEVRFQIADGYYMYRDRFKFETAAGKLLADVGLPKGKVKEDPFFGKTETYRREVRIRVPVSTADAARGNVKIKVTSQGCADIGVCYLPLEQFVEVRLPRGTSNARARVIPPAPSQLDGSPTALRERPSAVPQGGSR